ncbi:MAG TPA: thiamine-phosphate kinase [Blastocatellia bacterium]|jgi:thiamine-monophosphate kinase|nr:thiamine-phosphate kinase [Blastocatellia bacterium]
MQSEFDFIKRVRDQAPKRQAPDLVFGIGDDAAILREREGRETLVTVDLLVEEIDFKLEYAPPRLLGHRALAVSLSDIAAMGGAPAFSLLTLGIPKRFQISNPESKTFFEEFFAGYFALAEEHSVTLIGGDLSSTPDRLTIDSIVIGHCRAGGAVRRGGAKVGDSIYLTGAVGASAAGLKLLLNGARVIENEDSPAQSALRAHLKPEPPVAFGRRIADRGLAHSMIDVSDGLAQDLLRICEESGAAAIVDFDSVPLANEVGLISKEAEVAFEFAVQGGEDFELLLTASGADEVELIEIAADCGVKLSRIGEIIPAHQTRPRPLLSRGGQVKPLSIHGFDHFQI